MTALPRSPAPDRAFRRAAFPCREAAEPSARVPVSLSGDGDAASHGSSGEVEKHAVIRARLRLHEPLAVGTSATIDELHTLVVVDAATQRAVAAGSIDACDA